MTEKIIAYITIIGLLCVFFISYIWNKKTKVPKGCEAVANEHCGNCGNKLCHLKTKGSGEENE